MIQFFRGSRILYNPETHGNGIYFATDTQEILHGDKSYSGKLDFGKVVEKVEQVSNTLKVTYTDSTENILRLNQYSSKIEDTTFAMPITYGDFEKGTTVEQLNGKSYDELFDGLLFPSINPTYTEASINGFILNPGVDLVKLGSSVSSITPAVLNRGSWNEYNENAPYTGVSSETLYNFSINGETYNSISDLSGKNYNTLGDQTYNVVISYESGEAPKNNKGQVVENIASPSGSKSTTRTVNVTVPWFATTINKGELTEQALVKWDLSMSTGNFTLVAHEKENPQQFMLPRQATSMTMFSTIANAHVSVDISPDWTENTVTETIAEGIDHTYYLYTFNGNPRGPVELNVKF